MGSCRPLAPPRPVADLHVPRAGVGAGERGPEGRDGCLDAAAVAGVEAAHELGGGEAIVGLEGGAHLAGGDGAGAEPEVVWVHAGPSRLRARWRTFTYRVPGSVRANEAQRSLSAERGR